MEKQLEFRKYILEQDKTHPQGVIIRDKDFKIIQVGDFKVGERVKYTTPVRDEESVIVRFELPYAVFSCGRVEIEKLRK